ncbi:unnamed protein product [Ectocarpus sp. 13 AM-2016]
MFSAADMAKPGFLSLASSCGGERLPPRLPPRTKGVMVVMYRRLNAGRSLLLATLYDGEETLLGVGLFFFV